MLNPNYNKHNDVNRLINFINAAKIISMKQAVCFLYNSGLDEERTRNVLNILKKSGKARFSANKDFISTNPVFLNNASKYFYESNKISWLYITLLSNFNSINFDCKYPCKAFFYDTENNDTLHIFEVRNANLDEDCIQIDTNFSTPNTKNHPIKSLILIDNIDDIDKIFLSECINIFAFVIVKIDDKGIVKVKFYDKEKDELEVA